MYVNKNNNFYWIKMNKRSFLSESGSAGDYNCGAAPGNMCSYVIKNFISASIRP